ncbi:hypothetical protein CC78DRAFT_581109 [Lojkania enalia]|uniref:Uncharacterized protein n=1 Tax=Lojkania enalia TaxID=147567 RepID=A0A9P4N5S5_9PLEO|nr:hypothetical protein CC78DRAFT_581109 [Didymosphaeria enalia]
MNTTVDTTVDTTGNLSAMCTDFGSRWPDDFVRKADSWVHSRQRKAVEGKHRLSLGEWYRQGKLLVDKLVKYYPVDILLLFPAAAIIDPHLKVDEFEKALEDKYKTSLIKPVLLPRFSSVDDP